MIALDPEFLGGFAPQSQLTEGVDRNTMSFARQPRIHRLRIQGKTDKTEDASENESVVDCPADSSNPSNRDRMGQEKRKMRGKDKSVKRYLRKQRKNVIDPRAAAIREALAIRRAQARSAANDESKSEGAEQPSALDRFHRKL